MTHPRFIVVEGVEGAGKTTQVQLLSAWLEAAAVPFVAAREPGETAVGEDIRRVLLDRPDVEMPAETELLLMLAARAAFVRSVVRPALERGQVVLADRFDLSSLAYQGYGRGIDLATVRRLNDFATGGLVPDLYVILDVPYAEGARRQNARGAGPDRIERAGTAFMERVQNGYRELAERIGPARMVDARGTPSDVHGRVRALLADTFPETFPGGQG